ncbi:MAG: HypC/HybG/HupF family hydrogenase formation chaperone [Haloarculaceae archaeon]
MCLGIPGTILEIDGHEAPAEFWNVEKSVRLDTVGEEVEEGDSVLNHELSGEMRPTGLPRPSSRRWRAAWPPSLSGRPGNATSTPSGSPAASPTTTR